MKNIIFNKLIILNIFLLFSCDIESKNIDKRDFPDSKENTKSTKANTKNENNYDFSVKVNTPKVNSISKVNSDPLVYDFTNSNTLTVNLNDINNRISEIKISDTTKYNTTYEFKIVALESNINKVYNLDLKLITKKGYTLSSVKITLTFNNNKYENTSFLVSASSQDRKPKNIYKGQFKLKLEKRKRNKGYQEAPILVK